MECPKCHFKNPSDSHFCSKCGTQILAASNPLLSQTKTMQYQFQELAIGSVFAGRYQVVEELGSGGMGKVYKVFDKEVKEMIALKLLNPLIAADEKMIERFRNELKLARKITHKNVCRMYHLGEDDRKYYITMEYVQGEDLKSLIKKVGQLTLGKAVNIAKQSYEGLSEAHKMGVVHRDLKPQNIMIDKEGNVRIMDFGIARFQESHGITDTGITIGTPEYMSPEQVEGEEIDQRSDIYSSGIILYEMLTGSVPFEGNTPLSVAIKHKTEFPREPKDFNPQIPNALNQMVLRCLEKKKEKRYQGTDEILQELAMIERDIPTKEMILEAKKSILWSFLRKLKQRKIIQTVAAFIGGGVALIEFAHLILINHYHFPDRTVDFIIIALSIAMVSTVTWRWFHLQGVKQRRLRLIPKIKFKWIAAVIVAALLFFGGYRLWKGFIRPEAAYADFILLKVDVNDAQRIQKNLIEYLLLRSLEASTESRILIQQDYITYKKKTESTDEKPQKPVIAIYTDVNSKTTGFEDFDVRVEMNRKGKSLSQTFECKGPRDLILNKIDKIHSFVSAEAEEKIGKIEENKTFSQICTENWNALEHFLSAEDAWKNLETDEAMEEYDKAIQNDADFSLAYLNLAAAQIFRGDREEAEKNLQSAEKCGKLIKYDRIKLEALRSRLRFDPSKERQLWGQLVEAFPYNKEYHYELAEAYFQYGEGQEAIKHYKNTLELDPDYANAHNHIGLSYSWSGKHEDALRHLKRYVELSNTANSYDSLASGLMFAGRYNDAIDELQKGMKFEQFEDYLYGNMARNFMLKGALTRAAENLKNQLAVSKKEHRIKNVHFYQAFNEFLRGNLEKAGQDVKPVCEFYSAKSYDYRVDDAVNLPFWLEGLIAFEHKNLNMLSEMTKRIEKRMAKHREETGHEVNAFHYFPIYKYYIHLRMLEAYLKGEENEILRYIDEGQKIKEKMSSRTSMFNQVFFFNEYAAILMRLNRLSQAYNLLNEAIQYNPNYVSSHINLAKFHMTRNDLEQAMTEYKKAKELLSDADYDFISFKENEKMGKKLSSLSVSE